MTKPRTSLLSQIQVFGNSPTLTAAILFLELVFRGKGIKWGSLLSKGNRVHCPIKGRKWGSLFYRGKENNEIHCLAKEREGNGVHCPVKVPLALTA